MLIDSHRKQVRNYFWWESDIAEEVELARKEMAAKRHSRNTVGVDDPTGSFVVRKNMPLKKVTIFVHGRRVVISNPETWLKVIGDTYALYATQPISQMIRERIRTRKSVEVLSGFMGISRETYFRWENEFIDDAIFMAAKAGLFPEKNF